MSGFDSIAAYYEVLSDGEARLRREGAFLTECVRRAPGTRVVDVACGTGLHAAFFADLGAEVTALDLSAEMIAHARERRPHANVRYAVGDMRRLEGGPWDLAVCLGNSLSLLNSRADVEAAFRSVADSLAPRGLFIVQVLNYAAASAQQPRHRIERKTRDNAEIVAVKSLVPQGDRTLLSIAFFRREGDAFESATETAVLLHVGLEDIAAAAAQAGLEVVETFGGFDRSEYQAGTSSDLVCVLENKLGG
jgi:SAM-dependent methyltransferase